MKYGNIIEIKCGYCNSKKGYFLGEEKGTIMVGSIPKKYYKVKCLQCNIIQWSKD